MFEHLGGIYSSGDGVIFKISSNNFLNPKIDIEHAPAPLGAKLQKTLRNKIP